MLPRKLFWDIWIFTLICVWIYPFHTWISVPVGDEPADYSNDKDKCCKENYIWILVKRFYFWAFVCHFERWIYFTIPAIVHPWDDIFNLCFAQMFVSDLILLVYNLQSTIWCDVICAPWSRQMLRQEKEPPLLIWLVLIRTNVDDGSLKAERKRPVLR